MSSLRFYKTLVKNPVQSVLTICVSLWVAFIALKPALLGWSGESLIFGNLAVTSDGLDWIVQGFALHERVDEIWPQLRNIGFVLVATLGAAAEAPAVVIGMSLTIGLIVQFFFAYKISKLVTNRHYSRLLVIAVYSSLPFHFFSNYVLADTIAISLMLASTYFGLRNFLEVNRMHWSVAVALALLATLFQNYGWGALLVVFAVGIFREGKRVQEKLFQALSLFLGIGVQQLIVYAWTGLIEHRTQPEQFSFLAFKVDMFEFYYGIYSTIHAPLILAALTSLVVFWLLGNKLPRLNKSDWVLILLGAIGVAFTALVFFYQWPESRFSYIGTAFLVLAVSLAVARLADSATRSGAGIVLFSFLPLLLTGWFLLTPSSEWRPTLENIDYGSHWSLRDTYSNTTPSSWVLDATFNYCNRGGLLPTREALRDKYEVSNYQSNIGLFAISHCFFAGD